ncbi:MAG: hypothetical protein QM760_05885 [Nibricoccus sp.]
MRALFITSFLAFFAGCQSPHKSSSSLQLNGIPDAKAEALLRAPAHTREEHAAIEQRWKSGTVILLTKKEDEELARIIFPRMDGVNRQIKEVRVTENSEYIVDARYWDGPDGFANFLFILNAKETYGITSTIT